MLHFRVCLRYISQRLANMSEYIDQTSLVLTLLLSNPALLNVKDAVRAISEH